MKTKTYNATVFGIDCIVELMDFNRGDAKKIGRLFGAWKKLNMGMRYFGFRGVNIPEGISEGAFCIFSGSKRLVSLKNGVVSASFDTFNLETNRAEQIKASSVEYDLTSFGPRSRWDDLYFLDFYSNGEMDGSFDVYKIPNDLIDKVAVNSGQDFVAQQSEKRRPRFSIKKEIIKKHGLAPLQSGVMAW